MTEATYHALKQARAAINALFDAFEAEPLDQVEHVHVPISTTRPPLRPDVGTTRRPSAATPMRPSRGGLPTPLTPQPAAAKAAVGLDEATRKANLPDAIEVAKRIIKGIGPNSPQLVHGVQGQLALQRIPYDDVLVQQAIDASKGA